jgi:hypothetical protein
MGSLLLAAPIMNQSFAQPIPAPAGPKRQSPAAHPTPQSTPAVQQPVSIEQALYLIRSTLLTLNDANRSGNYTVLRDLAAPNFQARNTAADLGQIFSDLRRRNFDLYGAALLAPQLTATPSLDTEKRLHLTGFFATRPQQINFDLSFEVFEGQWRLFGLSIATPDTPPPAPLTSSQEATPKRTGAPVPAR